MSIDQSESTTIMSSGGNRGTVVLKEENEGKLDYCYYYLVLDK